MKRLLSCALILTSACAVADDKTLKLYNWADYFAANGCGDIVPYKKPAPDIYFWVLEKMRLSAADCIALEDSENGLRASLAAGIKTFITVNQYTRTQNFAGAAAVFDDLSDLSNFYHAAGLLLSKLPASV